MADLTAILNGPWEFPKFDPPKNNFARRWKMRE